jgi:hypothetical protein
MQFGMIHFETFGGTKCYVAFSTLKFHSSFFVLGGTHMALNFLTFNKPVSVVSCVMDGACLPFLVVKTLRGEGSVLVWGGSV